MDKEKYYLDNTNNSNSLWKVIEINGLNIVNGFKKGHKQFNPKWLLVGIGIPHFDGIAKRPRYGKADCQPLERNV